MEHDNFFADRQALITGGMGFLGSNLAHRLVGLGARVVILDNFLADHGANQHNIAGIEDRVRVIEGDIRDPAAADRAVAGADMVFHIAAQTSHTDSMKDPFLDIDINCRGNMTLLESLRRTNPGARVVLASSRAVYGAPETVPATERTLPNPADIYSADKLASENYFRIWHRVHGIPAVILRFSNGYGPRAQIRLPKYGILNWFVGQALSGKTIKVFGDGSQLRDYIYADDMIEAFLLAARSPGAVGRTYNIGGERIRFVDMVRALVRLAGGGFEFAPWPEDYRKIEVGDFASDSSLARDELGWRPSVELEQGLRATVEYYRDRLERYL